MSVPYRMSDLAAGILPSDAKITCEQALSAVEAREKLPDIVRRVFDKVFASDANRDFQRALTLAVLACAAGTGCIGAVQRPPTDIGISWLRVEEALEEWFVGDATVDQILSRVAVAAAS